MKKIYTLIAGVLLAGSVTAQLANGNFEAPITNPYPTFPDVSSTAGWGVNIYKGETAAPGEGAQSAKLITIVNPTLAAALQRPSDTLAGVIGQVIDGEITDAGDITVDFMAKYTAASGDSAVIVVEIYDTLAAGFNDDVLLFQGVVSINATLAAWTPGTVTLTAHPTNTGTANQMVILGSSSIGGIFGTSLPQPGSTLWLDAFEVNGYVGVNENKLTSSRIFPNPATTDLKFELNGTEATAINVYSLDGKLLLTEAVNGVSGSIDVTTLNAGMYLYAITTTSGETVSSTFVKQ